MLMTVLCTGLETAMYDTYTGECGRGSLFNNFIAILPSSHAEQDLLGGTHAFCRHDIPSRGNNAHAAEIARNFKVTLQINHRR